MSEIARIAGVFFEPKKTFTDIAARPTWILPVVIAIVISLGAIYMISSHVGWERIAAQQIASEGKRLRNGSYISIELNSATPVPEWGGQKVFVMMEDDAYLTDEGFKTFLPRQTSYYLIHP